MKPKPKTARKALRPKNIVTAAALNRLLMEADNVIDALKDPGRAQIYRDNCATRLMWALRDMGWLEQERRR